MAPSRPPRPPPRPARDPKDLLKKRGADLIRKISDKDRYGIFLEPVDVDAVEGYAELISRPMDLSTAQKNLQMGVYRTPMELRADLDLIWSNCCTFNADDSIYFKEAVRLRALAARYYDDLVRLLTKDGVSAALGLPNSRSNGPSAARISQKRPPRHRLSSQHSSDFGGRLTSPSLQTSDLHSVDADVDSITASASASAGNLTPFRDVHLRRARANYDAAVTAAATSAAEVRDAAKHAALPISLEPPETNEIFAGPGNCFRTDPETPVRAAVERFPIMHSKQVKDSCREIPIAWRRIGRWHPRGATQSRFLSNHRMRDIQFGRQYQKFVHKSAPVARRLLATVLDPSAVRGFDLRAIALKRRTSKLEPHKLLHCNQEKAHLTVGDPIGRDVANGKVENGPKNGLRDPMDLDGESDDSTTGLAGMKLATPNKRPRHSWVAGVPNGNCFSHNTTAGAFAADLREWLGSEQFNKISPPRIDDFGHSAQSPPQKNAVNKLRSLLRGKGIDSAFIDDLMTEDAEKDHRSPALRDKVILVGGEDESHRRNLTHVLTSNHSAMMNVLRLRALRECADEATRENLEDRERECVEQLTVGMSIAVRSLPPRYVVHPIDVTEAALALSRTILHSRSSSK